ncbi:hypothetical protein IW139_002073 [Coemansia sp. RSA 353]|nr:hypothetical protein GGH15_003115 [Coemansia sp. RSA 562]KAJ2193331.1 hypothetical protein IW144_004492 [Coemansia sp. RSA 522]KAJ2229376.1 hypothetical protein GGH97_006301 [Coemansia sp. RSA 475]KAJ2272890.1 hypothetical protein J3F81_002880 [Coemansia sp. RSA 371]KAJ2289983.1 hypothetical protein IW141_003540 [Coemansia sp. RSA 355]KAJ2298819.1 hypothetical protein IW139_002073 [Coemansia sp. RSA 353]KAJ2426322.1 hypothetical protein GGF47_002206 [Coemansia sp. RSA 2524]KAJ2439097.1 hy
MRFFTTVALTISAVVAQEIGVSSGDRVSAGASAIDHPNVNNGMQSDGSLFVSGTAGQGGLFNNVVGSHFVNANLNTAFEDNLVNNPGFTSIAGNSGWVANGDRNALGSVQNVLVRRGEYHAAAPAYNAPASYHPAMPAYSAPVVYHPVGPIVVPAPVHYYAPVFHAYPAPSMYKAPVAEKPAHYAAPEYHAPVAEKPAHYAAPEYHAPIAAPAYHSAVPAPIAVPVEIKKSAQTATIIQNQA